MPIWTLRFALPGALHNTSKLTLAPATVTREMDRLITQIGAAADKIYETIEAENQSLPEQAKRFFAGEGRVLRSIRYIVIEEMRRKLWPGL